MNITTRSIAALAASGALVVGGAAAATATATHGDSNSDQQRSVDHTTSAARSEVAKLIHDAFKDGTVTLKEEDAIKKAIEDSSNIDFESLNSAASQG
jgi:dienelactone hydrolase